MPDPCLPRHAHKKSRLWLLNVGCFASCDLQMILHLRKSVTAADSISGKPPHLSEIGQTKQKLAAAAGARIQKVVC